VAKEKSQVQQAMDEIQASVRPFLKDLGFRSRARAFNRVTSDGLTQAIEFQMGRFDPPGTHYVGFRRNWYGKFTVNVGVFVPELHEYIFPGKKLPYIHEYDCWIRERLGSLGPEQQDIWWALREVPQQAADVFHRIERDALPFLARFESREAILTQWTPGHVIADETEFGRFTRSREQLACGIILAKRGRNDEAKSAFRAAIEYQPEHPSSSRVRRLLENLETLR
jgi:hypothetical protein